MSQIMGTTFRKVVALLKLGQQLANVLQVDWFAIGMHDDKVCVGVLTAQTDLVLKAGDFVIMPLLDPHLRGIKSSKTCGSLIAPEAILKDLQD